MYKPKSYEYVFVVLYLVIQNKTNLPEVIIIDSETHNDFRGFLRIGYGKEELQHIGIHFEIEQINYGYSVHEHTLRGMHFQEGEYAQAKLVPCLQGALYSVAVDIRKDSQTYGKWAGEILTSENGKCMYIPKGFAHGYITIQPNTLLQYCVDVSFHGPSAMAISYRSFYIQ